MSMSRRARNGRDSSDAHHAAATEAVREAQADFLVLPASACAEILVDPWRAGVAAVAVMRQPENLTERAYAKSWP